jgi:hypothetical protein
MNQLATGDQNGVFENSGRFFSMNFRDLEIMPVQVKRMHVVAFVDESEPVAATPVDLDRFALERGVRRSAKHAAPARQRKTQ